MPADLNTPRQDEPKQTTAPIRSPSCPCCAGVLLVLRGMFRCARCHYSLCAGCEPVGTEEAEGE